MLEGRHTFHAAQAVFLKVHVLRLHPGPDASEAAHISWGVLWGLVAGVHTPPPTDIPAQIEALNAVANEMLEVAERADELGEIEERGAP